MDKFRSRLDIFGTTIWTPNFSSPRLADLLAAMLNEVALDNDCTDFASFARALDVNGVSLTMIPNHHGRPDTWSANLREGQLMLAKIKAAA